MKHVIIVSVIARISSANTIDQFKTRITNIFTSPSSAAMKENAETALAALKMFADTQDPCLKFRGLLETKLMIPAMPQQLRNSLMDILLQSARSLRSDKKCIPGPSSGNMNLFGSLFPSANKNEEYIASLGLKHDLPILATFALAPHIPPKSPESWGHAWSFLQSESILGHTIVEMTTMLFREVQEVACLEVEILDEGQIEICETLGMFASSVERWQDAEKVKKFWLYCLDQFEEVA
jgi:hypothetical protein